MGLILHILTFILLLINFHLLLPGIGPLISHPGYLLYLLNLLLRLRSVYPLLYLLIKIPLLLQGLQLLSLALRHLSSHSSRESSPEILLLLTGEKIGTR